jgi:hypothetical protein
VRHAATRARSRRGASSTVNRHLDLAPASVTALNCNATDGVPTGFPFASARGQMKKFSGSDVRGVSVRSKENGKVTIRFRESSNHYSGSTGGTSTKLPFNTLPSANVAVNSALIIDLSSENDPLIRNITAGVRPSA